MSDSGLSVILSSLAQCLCAQIATDGLPQPCFCGVVPGDTVIMDYAYTCQDNHTNDDDCGMAWVRVVNLYPAVGTGVPATNRPGNCGSALGADLEMGIVRCVPGTDSQGNPPEPAALLAASLLQADDATTMRSAVACCEVNDGWVLNSYAPFGPEGNLVGGLWTMSLLVF